MNALPPAGSRNSREVKSRGLSTERKVQAGFAFALVCLGVIGVMSYLSVSRLREDADWSRHTERVISSLRLLLSTATDAETAQRGYVITGDESFLQPYDQARKSIATQLQALRKMTADHAGQQRQLDLLGPLIAERMAVTVVNVELRRSEDFAAAQGAVASSKGRLLHGRIRALISEMEATEQALLKQREARADQSSERAQTIIVAGSLLALGVVGVALFAIERDFAGSRRAEAALREANALLESRVVERTAELEAANATLQQQISDRAQTDERVRWLASIPEQNPNPVAEFERESGALTYANPAATRALPDLRRDGLAHPSMARVRELARGWGDGPAETVRLETALGEECYVLTVTYLADTQRVRVYGNDITERKRAEEALRASEELYRALFEHAPDGIVIADPESTYLDANASICRMLGYSRDEMIGLHASDIVTEPERQHIGTALGIIKGRSEYQREWQFRRKDGSVFEGEVIATMMPDGNLLGMIRDLTEKKQTEKAQRESEEGFQTMANSIPQLAWIARADGYIFWYNQRWYEYTGTTQEQMEGWDWQSVHHPGMLPKVMQRWTEAIDSGEPFEMEFPLLGADGLFRAFLTRVLPLKDSEGRVMKWFGTNTDVETLKQAEAAIRESEAYFRFLNDLAEATRTLSDPVRIMSVMTRMLGGHLRASRCAYADVELDGEHFIILDDYTDGCPSTVGDYQLSLFGARAVATLSSGQTLIIRNVDAELLPGEGADMFNAIGIQAIITCPLVKDGTLRAMMAVHQTTPRDWQPREIILVQDVVERCWATIERRAAEETIHQLNTELEERVIERTAQLESANKELEAFSYSVSHDLRAPLRAVDGFSQALLEDYAPQLPEQGQRYLRTVRESAQQMGKLIDDLLSFSRLSRQPLARRTVETEPLVRATLADLHDQIEGRQLEIRIGELPPCAGDPALLKQVWVNLLSNALKYSRKREHALVEIGCAEEKGESVYFVRDNGSGFDMRYAGKLFGVFQRLHRAEDYEGTGVGLAIVQRIIHRHGGRIWAESAPDQGATFFFTLSGGTEL